MNNGIAIFVWLLQATIGGAIFVGIMLCVLWHIAVLMAMARAAVATELRFSLRDLLALMTVVAALLAFLALGIRP
jgi:hypothetical protein